MFRRVMAFIFGMLFGIIFIIAAVGVTGYIAVTMVHPADVWSDSSKYFGDLATMSIADVIKEIDALYKENAMTPDPDTGEYFSVADFETRYNVDLSVALGFELSDDLKKLPFLTLFTEGGVQKAMAQTPVSAVTGFLTFIGAEANEKLKGHSLAELSGENPIGTLLGDITFGELLPDVFPETNENKLYEALSVCSIGNVFTTFAAGNFTAALKADGALESIGQLKFTDLTGSDSQLLTSVLGDYQLTDIIGDDGSIVPENVLNDVYIGSVMGLKHVKQCMTDGTLTDCDKNHVHEEDYWATVNGDGTYTKATGVSAVIAGITYKDLTTGTGIDGVMNGILIGDLIYQTEEITPAEINADYTDYFTDTQNAGKVFVKGTGDNAVYAKLVKEEYREAILKCVKVENTDGTAHVHTPDCFNIQWYETVNNVKQPATGILAELANVSLEKITSGTLDIMETIGGIKIGDIIGGNLTGVLSELADKTLNDLVNGAVDDIYIGSIVGYERHEITDTTGYRDLFENTANAGKVFENTANDIVIYEHGKYYTAEHTASLINSDSTPHVHTPDCYDFVWYTINCIDQTHGGAHEFPACYEKASGVIGKLAKLTIGDLTGGNIDDEIFNMTLGDVLGDRLPDMLKSLADTKIGDLGTAVNTLVLGEILGYSREKYTGTLDNFDSIYTASDGAVYSRKISAEITLPEYIITKDNSVYFAAYNTCENTDAQHLHSYKCFTSWAKESGGNTVHPTGAEAAVCDLSVNELTANGLQSVLDELTLGDVIKVNQSSPAILKALQNVAISELGNKINDVRLGEVLGYEAGAIVTNITEYTDVSGTDGKVRSKISGADTVYVKADGSIWRKAAMRCERNHAHTDNCYTYWSKTVNDAAVYPAAVENSLADMTVGNLSLTDSVNKLTLGDVLGISDDETGILAVLKDKKIGELATSVGDVKIGDVMGYVKKAVDPASYNEFVQFTEDGKTYTVKTDGTLYIMSENGADYFETVYDCTAPATHTTTHTSDCFSYLWYADTTYTNKITGMNNAVAGFTVNGLKGDKLKNAVNGLTLSDVLGAENCTGALSGLKDTKIGELSTAFDTLYLGQVTGYSRDNSQFFDPSANGYTAVDNTEGFVMVSGAEYVKHDSANVWYTAYLSCNTVHAHDKDCYSYWYKFEGGNKAFPTGVISALVDLTVTDLSDSSAITNKINTLTLNDLGIGGASPMLKALADTPVGQLSGAIDDMKMGVILKLEKHAETDTDSNYSEIVAGAVKQNNLDSSFIKLDADGKWYFAELDCKDTTHNSNHTASCYSYLWFDSTNSNAAVGLNKMLANKSLSDLSGNGILDIVQSMTIKDMTDSGILNIPVDNYSVFDILFCLDQTNCNYAQFMTTKALSPQMSAKSYYESKRTSEADRNQDRANWMEKTVNTFISGLLSALPQ